MKTATLHELKITLSSLTAEELLDICTRLARFKKENKELLTYLLYESTNERAYIQDIQAEIESEISAIPKDNNLYLIKKSLRRILRNATKYIRYAGSKTVEIEVLIFFCECLKEAGIELHKSQALTNLYAMQLKKVKKTIITLHEDLQYDFKRRIEHL